MKVIKEDWDNEDIFLESKNELYHILVDMSGTYDHNIGGFLSHLPREQRNRIAKAFENYTGRELTNNWEVHHINGLHDSSNKSKNNNYSNLSFVTKDAHRELTSQNRKIVNICISDLVELTDYPQIDKLIIRCIANCIACGKNPSEIFRIKTSDIKSSLNKIIDDIIDNFYKYKNSHPDEVITFDDLQINKKEK